MYWIRDGAQRAPAGQTTRSKELRTVPVPLCQAEATWEQTDSGRVA
ncbi:hypothetical protein ACIQGZ_17610 [Streptomyces sp. NPDC092296]